jgi:hypothetical protein
MSAFCLVLCCVVVLIACKTRNKQAQWAIPLPDFAVYQLKNVSDTSKVFLNLDESKSFVVYYPSPTDLGRMAKIEWVNGYVIDKRGVSSTTVFTAHTQQSYMQQGLLPDLATWMNEIQEFEPFLSFYRCKGITDLTALRKQLSKGKPHLCECLILKSD